MPTMDWANRSPIYIFSILPCRIATFRVLTVIMAIYSLVKSWKARQDPLKQTSFPTLRGCGALISAGLGCKAIERSWPSKHRKRTSISSLPLMNLVIARAVWLLAIHIGSHLRSVSDFFLVGLRP
ncbi:hypothetical protein PAXRUDRAFT_602933 [Paxillus rubicundulus Ve08.2h10]|uniref:Uncharacterized protein n=1 Tax=Paxillus rubicundulus Ve08.2h10 TaxID=930991 RepID=A0A0D0D0I0_9AGAM|nr:hypothetical protein PAXRUDRAFT_602933 [Paxillus rubicundulus Ve08.2h10]